MASESDIYYVQALYSFTGKNNDELCFKKGDVIIVTQKEEGGWWEGTLEGSTGWFPSNYVVKCLPPEIGGIFWNPLESPTLSPEQNEQQVTYRAMVEKDLLTSERAHVAELQSFKTQILSPLSSSFILTDEEFKRLTGDDTLEEIIICHGEFLTSLEAQINLPFRDQRVGGVFLHLAASIGAVQKAYISGHPKATAVIENHKDELSSFLERQGVQQKPGILALSSGLSLPFRRLDKYPCILTELHRHMEESHSDRGDTQRSIAVYKDLVKECATLRRQKQLELDVVTNRIQGWREGDTLEPLGEVIRLTSVALHPDLSDRYMVLFPSCIVVLSLSARASSFVYQGMFTLDSLATNKIEDGGKLRNALEILGESGEKMVVLFQSKTELSLWCEALDHLLERQPDKLQSPKINALPSVSTNSSLTNSAHQPWVWKSLRPASILRPSLPIKDDKKTASRNKKKDEAWNEDDALILSVIEHYCVSSKSRFTVNSNVLESNTRISTERAGKNERKPNEVEYLSERVVALQRELSSMGEEHRQLRAEFDRVKTTTQKLKIVMAGVSTGSS